MRLMTRSALLLLLLLGLNSCGTGDSVSGVYTQIDPTGFPIVIVLSEDGTGTFTYGGEQIGPEEALVWEYQDNGGYEVDYFDDEGAVIAVEQFTVEDGNLVFVVNGETYRYRKSTDAL